MFSYYRVDLMLDTGKQTLVSSGNSESNRSEARRPRRLQYERLWKLITLGMEMEQTVPGALDGQDQLLRERRHWKARQELAAGLGDSLSKVSDHT